MALALLASRNESYFGEQKVYARKNPSSNPNPKLCPNPNFNFQTAGDGGHESHRCPQHEFGPMDLDEPSPSPSAAVAADDSSSFVRNPADLGHWRDPAGGCVTFDISSYSRKERRELKRRLEAELEQLRGVRSRIESREIRSRLADNSTSTSAALPAIHGSDAFIGSFAPPKLQTDEIKRRPVAVARTMTAASPELRKLHASIMKKCGQILARLMKHKGGSWFNLPVDVQGMGLHDYHLVVKNPMDLGTVKSKLSKGFYAGPFEFASDIRLTFNNALIYNPRGHLVHNFADLLLKQFETSFRAAYSKYKKDRSAIQRREAEQKQRAGSWARVAPAPGPPPVPSNKPLPLPVTEAPPVTSKLLLLPVPEAPPVMSKLLPLPGQSAPCKPQQQQQTTVGTMKQPQPRPKVSELNQRAMSLEEKERLGYAIQSLPDAKMDEVLQILNRKKITSANGDEVEIDFEVMGNETLWELDQFVADWNKTLSRMKKRQLETTFPLSLPSDAGNKVKN